MHQTQASAYRYPIKEKIRPKGNFHPKTKNKDFRFIFRKHKSPCIYICSLRVVDVLLFLFALNLLFNQTRNKTQYLLEIYCQFKMLCPLNAALQFLSLKRIQFKIKNLLRGI